MIETTILWVAFAATLVGLAIGCLVGGVLFYYVDFKPLRSDYHELVRTLTNMKKQGFVPQYDIEQRKEIDHSDGINES